MSESIRTFDKLFGSVDDNTYVALEFLDGSSLGVVETFLDPNGMRGSRQHDAERVRRSQRFVQGTLRFAPVPTELDFLLPAILGADESADSFALAETIPYRYFTTSRDGTLHKYQVKVNRAVFEFAEGAPLTLSLDVIGVDESAGSSRSEALGDDGGPYVMSDAGLTIGGTTYQFRSGQLEINNFLEVKYNNSVTPSAIHSTDLQIQIAYALPYGDASAAYGTAVTGVASVLTFTNGNRSTVFTLAGVAAPKQSLPLGGRGARDLPWTGIARRTGSTAPLVVTNDSTG